MPSPATLTAFADAITANDAGGVAALLERESGLAGVLNSPLRGLSFDATPLLSAVWHGNRELIDVLLRAGADINARSGWWAGGFGVLDSGGQDLASYLIARGARVDVHAAARLGMTDALEALLASDRSLVGARGGDGQTPLHFAATVAIATILLDCGADIDALDVDHESTPAQYMVRDRQDVARYLVGRGCRTDILLAAALGDDARVLAHLESDPRCIGASVSERWFPKRNPHSGGTIYTWTLGADKTPHAVAREFGHAGVFDLLMARSPDALALAQACMVGDAAIVEALLARNPGLPRSLSPTDHRLLADAARNNDARAVALLLRAGWPIDATGQHGATALHWAAFHGHAGMVEELVRHHAALELTDRDHGGTPIGWCIHGSRHGWHRQSGNYAGTAEALLRAGAAAPARADGSPAVQDVLRRHAGR